MDKDNHIKVSAACFIFKDGKVLLGQRVSKSHGGGDYSCGGGHVEFMENVAEAAKREIAEEWRIAIDEPQFLCVTNLKKYSAQTLCRVHIYCQLGQWRAKSLSRRRIREL